MLDLSQLSLSDLRILQDRIIKEENRRKNETIMETVKENINMQGWYITYACDIDLISDFDSLNITYTKIQLPVRFISHGQSKYVPGISGHIQVHQYDYDDLPDFIDPVTLPSLQNNQGDDVSCNWHRPDHNSPYETTGTQDFYLWHAIINNKEQSIIHAINIIEFPYIRCLYIKRCDGYAFFFGSEEFNLAVLTDLSIPEILAGKQLSDTYVIYKGNTYIFCDIVNAEEISTAIIIK